MDTQQQGSIQDDLKNLGDELRGRLDEIDRRLRALEGGKPSGISTEIPSALERALGHESTPPPRADLRTVTVTISPLHDVSKVRVVEAALAAIDGVEAASLRELQGDAAQIDVKVLGDIPLISGLRRTLPVAFDVSASDRSSFTIALAQPQGERDSGVAAPSAS
jgi:hypothetical protein